ncbi:MAG: helix-turn-helix domain-containing protein [Candidatus Aenigmatarchaeota archaeon]
MSVLCEVMVRQIIPAVRVKVAKQLYTKGLKQEEIAKKLGLTQAAISKYLSGKYTQEVRKLEKSEAVKKISDKIVKAILKKSFKSSDFQKIVCEYCKKEVK